MSLWDHLPVLVVIVPLLAGPLCVRLNGRARPGAWRRHRMPSNLSKVS